jgi:hypothetical protein
VPLSATQKLKASNPADKLRKLFTTFLLPYVQARGFSECVVYHTLASVLKMD